MKTKRIGLYRVYILCSMCYSLLYLTLVFLLNFLFFYFDMFILLLCDHYQEHAVDGQEKDSVIVVVQMAPC